MTETRTFTAEAEARGRRLDQFLVEALSAAGRGVSRSRVQLLLEQGGVRVNGSAEKASYKLRGGEQIRVTGEPHPAPLRATPEAIPLEVVYEDADLAVVNKPAGMMVHAGAGRSDDAGGDARNRGTLVNALLHRFGSLSTGNVSGNVSRTVVEGGGLRPGIVHRLDKQTSGLIVVAKNDQAHALLSRMFAERKVHKTYIALVEGEVKRDRGTINAAVSRDPVRRTRMTTQPNESARTAVSHYEVMRRISTRFGKFTLVRVRIETGRTHQIRVHMASMGHAVVGDTLYGGAGQLVDQEQLRRTPSRAARRNAEPERLKLGRNFLHAARLEFAQPRTQKPIALEAPLPGELEEFLGRLENAAGAQAGEEFERGRAIDKMGT